MADEFPDSPEIKSGFLKTCDVITEEPAIEPFVFVIFGAAGDLSRKKLLPTLFHICQENNSLNEFAVIGFGMPGVPDGEYRAFARGAVKKFGLGAFKEKDWSRFERNVSYLSADFAEAGGYKALCECIENISFLPEKGGGNIIFYLAVPPEFVPVIVGQLSSHNMCKGTFRAKIVVEKPFGTDRETAARLNRQLLKAFDEEQIYRIDHYLGKETVQNIIFFRFANSIFEPLWNRRYVDHVQVTVAETISVESRGSFYEKTGVVRDIVQNHVMQLIALVAMEPPVGFEADLIRDEKVKVFRTIRSMDDAYIDKFTVKGQYGPGKIEGKDVPGYRQEEKVSRNSGTPTYFAGKFYLDNWRWAGVPFFVRAGKRLAERVTEILVQFKQPPLRLFGRTCDVLEPNALVLGIRPEEAIILRLTAKHPGSGNRPYVVDMDFNYRESFNVKKHIEYERLILDCMRGDLTLFARQDGVEAMWSVVDPIIRRWEEVTTYDFPNYPAGSWGPPAAAELK